MFSISNKSIRFKFPAMASFFASLALLLLTSCAGDSSSSAADSPNAAFYQALKELKADGPLLQAPPAELFSEHAKVFDLAQVPAKQTAKLLSSQALPAEFALYAPRQAGLSGLAKAAAAAVPGSGIPGFKPADAIPSACADAAAADLPQCLEENNLGLAPELFHSSNHDATSLAIMLGEGSGATVVNNVLSSFNDHIDATTRDAIRAQLNGYITAIATHAAMDLGSHGMYDSAGYYLQSAVVTDGGRADSDGDGELEPHSTLIVELRKPLKYVRMPESTLDSAIKAHNNGAIPEEVYEIVLKVYIHLNHLARFRPEAPPLPAETTTTEQESALSAQALETYLINHAFDANIIKKVLISGGVLPWNCTEYSIGFQLSSDTMAKHYAPILAKAEAAEDTAAVAAIEEHMDAQTALVTGGNGVAGSAQKSSGTGPVTVMYQISRPGHTGKATASGGYDYAMVDSSGRRIAIYDPASGAIVIAGSQSRLAPGVGKQVAMTKAGACSGNSGNWAYQPSRVRTPRFGRGIQFILTEWLIHNQVGDYKNIHWYQSVWKSGVQVAVKGAKYVAATYLKVQVGSIKLPKDPDERDKKKKQLAVLKVFLPLVKDAVMKLNGIKIAGYSLPIPVSVGNFLSGSGSAFGSSNTTFDYWLLLELGSGDGKGFFIDRMTDAAAQMLDVTIVGWQDISDRSHYGCFEFD